MAERIYRDSNTLVEFNPIRSTITVDVSGCGDCYSFYYWNLSKVLRLFTRRYAQCRDINHGEDFKSLIYHNHLGIPTISKFNDTIYNIVKEYLHRKKLLIDKKDFKYSYLKDRPIELLKHLCEKYKIKL